MLLRVALDLHHQPGVAELDAVTGGCSVDGDVVVRPSCRALRRSGGGIEVAGGVRLWRARHSLAPAASSGPSTSPAKPMTTRSPPIGASPTVTVAPGSKRIASPASMARRMP